MNTFTQNARLSFWFIAVCPSLALGAVDGYAIANAQAGSGTLTLSTTGSWTAVSSATWLTVSPASGTDSATLTYYFDHNRSDIGRVATITAGGRVFSITQTSPTGATPAWGSSGLGTIKTIAGSGNAGYGGDCATGGGFTPVGLTTDAEGNVYFADIKTYSIKKVAVGSGVISTVAGTGVSGFSGDGGLASNAQLVCPHDVTVDNRGNLFIADGFPTPNGNRVRKVDRGTGIITTLAGTGQAGFSGDGGPATSAQLNTPVSVAVDNNGNVYVAEFANHRIRRINAAGIITTFAGTGIAGYSGDNGAATLASLNSPVGVHADSSGSLYIAEYGNNTIRKVDTTTNIITSVASVNQPHDVTVDRNGNIFASDYFSNIVYKITPGGLKTAFAGTGATASGGVSAQCCGDGGAASSAQLYFPHGLAFDPWGNLFISDRYNFRVRMIDLTTAGKLGMISLNNTSASVPASGGSGTVSVVPSPSDYSIWQVAGYPSWVTVSKSGNIVSWSASANASINSRSATIAIGGQTFTLTQSGVTGSVTLFPQSDTALGTATSGKSISVTSNATDYAWTASSNSAWLTITSGASTTGSGTVTYSVAANTSANSRTGTLTVGGQSFTVTQSGITPTYTLANATGTAPATAGSSTLGLTVTPSDATWIATSNAAWLTVSPSSGTGSATLTYSYTAATTVASRTGTVTAGGQTFTLIQSGLTGNVTLTPASDTIAALGTTGKTVTVTANAPDFAWTATSNAAWLTITSGASITGSGTVTYNVAANTSANSRTGTLTIGGQTFSVAQVKEQQALLAVNAGANTVNLFELPSESTTATVSVGWAPIAVAVNTQGTTAYVVNCGGLCTLSGGAYNNAVSVVDLGTTQVKAVIPVGINPIAIALNPTGTRAFVHNSQSGTLSIIDTSTNVVVATLPSCGRGIAVHPTLPRLYLSCGRVIDTSTNTEITTIAGVTGPDIAIHPSGAFVYITTNGTTENTPGRVSVINTSTNSVTATIAVGNFPYSIALNPAGTRAYVANYNSGSVSAIDLVTNSLLNEIAVAGNPRAVGVSADGQRVYVAKGAGANMVVLDGASNISLGEIPVSAEEFTLLQTGIRTPGAPRSVTALNGEGSASVSFQPPLSTGGSTVSGYTVISSPGGISATGTSSPVTISGLSPGLPYTFVVQAANTIGSGNSSAPSNSVTPYSFSFTGNTASAPATAGTGSIGVITTPSNVVWTPTSNVPWLTVASTPTTGSTTLNYSYSANGNVAPRTGTINVGTQAFTVVQSGISGSVTLLPGTDTATAAGATGKTVAVTANATDFAWTATSNAAWLTITAGASTTGSGTVTYNVAANTSANSRTGTLTIGSQTFTLTQSGVTPTYSFSQSSATVGAGNGSGSVSLTVTPADAIWTSSSNAVWLTVSPTSGLLQTERLLFRVVRARMTFARISCALAVQMKGLGSSLWLST